MFILKTKGTSHIPDYVQIRDDDFTLLSHFKTNSSYKQFLKSGISENPDELFRRIEIIPYGKLEKI